MEKDIQISKELDAKIELVSGNVKLSLIYAGTQMKAGMNVELSPEVFVDQLKAAIKGPYDDAILDGLLLLLKAVT